MPHLAATRAHPATMGWSRTETTVERFARPAPSPAVTRTCRCPVVQILPDDPCLMPADSPGTSKRGERRGEPPSAAGLTQTGMPGRCSAPSQKGLAARRTTRPGGTKSNTGPILGGALLQGRARQGHPPRAVPRKPEPAEQASGADRRPDRLFPRRVFVAGGLPLISRLVRCQTPIMQ
jgi:hypothetical protein